MPSIQEIFNLYGSDFIKKYSPPITIRKVIGAIKSCKTLKLGGHIFKRTECNKTVIYANSCRNRHCTKCQYSKQVKWVEKQIDKLINIQYFHVVFTIPDELRNLCFYNQKVMYNILFKAASKTLLQMSSSKSHLNAQIGITSILHTWTQKLIYHPHIHCIVTGGGLSIDKNKFVSSSKKFFLPVKAVSRKFRGKFIFYLKKAFINGELNFKGDLSYINNNYFEFLNYLNNIFKKEWIVYSKKPFSSPSSVLKYFGRYVHRVAISDTRIKAVKDNMVTFEYTDRNDSYTKKLMTITADDFIKRFCSHILPDKFVKIRHYGLHSNQNLNTKLKLCQQLTDVSYALAEKEKYIIEQNELFDKYCCDFLKCNHCGGDLELIASFIPEQSP